MLICILDFVCIIINLIWFFINRAIRLSVLFFLFLRTYIIYWLKYISIKASFNFIFMGTRYFLLKLIWKTIWAFFTQHVVIYFIGSILLSIFLATSISAHLYNASYTFTWLSWFFTCILFYVKLYNLFLHLDLNFLRFIDFCDFNNLFGEKVI